MIGVCAFHDLLGIRIDIFREERGIDGGLRPGLPAHQIGRHRPAGLDVRGSDKDTDCGNACGRLCFAHFRAAAEKSAREQWARVSDSLLDAGFVRTSRQTPEPLALIGQWSNA